MLVVGGDTLMEELTALAFYAAPSSDGVAVAQDWYPIQQGRPLANLSPNAASLTLGGHVRGRGRRGCTSGNGKRWVVAGRVLVALVCTVLLSTELCRREELYIE